MDLIATWDWRAWTILIPLVALVGWFLWRYVSALAFRYVLLGGVLRRHGWQADLPSAAGGRAAFDEQERRRRRKAWALLRRGPRGIREGYRTGVFGRSHSSKWHTELTITGTHRGRAFVAEQSKRFEVTSSGEGTRRQVRRRASLDVRAAGLPELAVTVSLLTGKVRADPAPSELPPGLEEWLRGRRLRFRAFRCGGAGVSLGLGPRLRRGRLLAGLNYVNEIADRLTAHPRT